MKSIYQEKKTKIYAIYGMGSTRFAIALGNYYCSYLRKKTAIIEVGEGNIADIPSDKSYKTKSIINEDIVGFTKMKLDYYPSLCYEEVLKILNGKYEIFIMDIKELSHDYINLFRLSDKSMFLCNIASFNRRSSLSCKNVFENGMVEVEFYCYLLNNEDKTWYENTYRNSKFYTGIKEMLFIKNPDRLSREDIEFLKTIGC